MQDRVYIFVTTLRGGKQSPGNNMNTQEKIRVARQPEILDVDIIEAGFPIASESDFYAVYQIAFIIKSSEVASPTRANSDDIDRVWETVKVAAKPCIHIFISTVGIHLEYQFEKNRDEILKIAVNSVKRERKYTAIRPTSNSRLWTPRGATGIIFVACLQR